MAKKARSKVTVSNQTKGNVVCSSARMADTALTRMFGLLLDTGLEEESGLLIRPSSGVHTFGMGFPIDIVALDKRSRVLGVWENIGPWKLRGLSFKTRSVLELPSGRAARCGLAVGDQLSFDSVAEPAL